MVGIKECSTVHVIGRGKLAPSRSRQVDDHDVRSPSGQRPMILSPDHVEQANRLHAEPRLLPAFSHSRLGRFFTIVDETSGKRP